MARVIDLGIPILDSSDHPIAAQSREASEYTPSGEMAMAG